MGGVASPVLGLRGSGLRSRAGETVLLDCMPGRAMGGAGEVGMGSE